MNNRNIIRLTKKTFVFLFFFCLMPLLYGNEVAVKADDNSNFKCVYDSLQNEKLKLEIRELKSRNNPLSWNLLSVIGAVIGIVTIVWTVYHGLKSYNNQIQQHKDKTISDLLVLLNDEKSKKRAGAAKALGKYANDVTDEIVSAIAIEEEDFVREIIENTFHSLTDENFEKIILANQKSLQDMALILGELSFNKMPIEQQEKLLNLSSKYRVQLTNKYKYLYDYGRQISNKREMDIRSKEYLDRIQKLIRVIESTGRIIERAIRDKKNVKLFDVNIKYANLYRINYKNQKFDNVYAANTICRHIRFEKAQLKDSYFELADMFDSKFINVTIDNCDFSSSTLRSSSGKKIKIKNSIFEEAILSQSKFDRLTSVENQFNRCKMRDFSAVKSIFIDTKFNARFDTKSELHNAKFSKSEIKRCEFKGAIIINGDFKNCIISDTHFNGADLRGANFENATLVRVDFTKANLKNIKNTNWKIEDCNFEGSENWNS